MKTFSLIFILFSLTNSQTIDSLMKKTLIAEMKAGRVSGYVFSRGQQTQLIPPNKLFVNRTPALSPLTTYSVNYETLQKEVYDLKIEQAKTSFIIESLIKQSESHTKNNNFMIKLIEILTASIASIITAYSIAKIKTKKS